MIDHAFVLIFVSAFSLHNGEENFVVSSIFCLGVGYLFFLVPTNLNQVDHFNFHLTIESWYGYGSFSVYTPMCFNFPISSFLINFEK